jgi:glycosyltransferase involved in cell wall biosynthesis
MRHPAVSVLLPARNAEGTLEHAVESIRAQTFRAWELVVVDDASTDGTARVLAALARREPRVRIVLGRGSGLVDALRAGLAACEGGWVARMDADDESHPHRLEHSLAALRADPELAAVGTQVEIFREDRPVSPNMELYARWLNSLTTPERLGRERFVESPLCHPSTTIRRSALDAVGGYDDGDLPEDYQLWLELLHAGWKLACVPQVLFRWRDHDRRLTRVDPRYAEVRFIAAKARYLARGPLAPDRRCAVWGAGRTGRALARRLRQENVEVCRFLEVDPAKIGTRIEGAPVLSWTSLGPPGEAHLLVAVGAKGAREEIRGALAARGWIEGRDFTCCA